jgi:hypothetical protein
MDTKMDTKEFEKRDIYCTEKRSVESFDGFLAQCKRAINKLYRYGDEIPAISVDTEFWSMNSGENGLTCWEYLKKYGCLTVQDGCFCVTFEYDAIVFAAYSSAMLIEMGVYTHEEINEYVDCKCNENF